MLLATAQINRLPYPPARLLRHIAAHNRFTPAQGYGYNTALFLLVRCGYV